MFFFGVLAFVLFFISDINDAWFQSRLLKPAFFLGAVFLTLAVVVLSVRGVTTLNLVARVLFGVLGVVFFSLLIYSLFIAIPVVDSYTKPGLKRPVYTQGVYALCRHPGVLWFTGLCFCLYAVFGFPLYAAISYSIFNGFLVLFEDKVVFPKVLSGYSDYSSTTPFLIPNRESISSCISYYRGQR
ncbi:MAG: hypothetical protein GX222_08785 [Ruminococcaceae bacterium]|nr:hypothetical protein [Oscillospiraceae bacterium]